MARPRSTFSAANRLLVLPLAGLLISLGCGATDGDLSQASLTLNGAPSASKTRGPAASLGILSESTAHLSLELNGEALSLERISSEATDDGALFWTGESQADNTSATLKRNGEALHGVIHQGPTTYRVTTAGGKTSMEKLPTEHASCGDIERSARAFLAFDSKVHTMDFAHTGTDEAGEGVTPQTIRVLVVYTEDARDAAGGTSSIQADIETMVNETQAAWTASGIVHTIRLAGTKEVIMDEGSHDKGSEQLEWLFRKANMPGESVYEKREDVDADVVAIVVTTMKDSAGDDICGQAYSIGADNGAQAVFTVKRGCALSKYSFAHELGHIFGARHDWYVDDSTSPYSEAHGAFISYGTGYRRTIMSYNTWCDEKMGVDCPRIGRFSTPYKYYAGYVLGNASYRYNVYAHHARGARIAHFR